MSNFDFDNDNNGRKRGGGSFVVMISIALVMLLLGTLIGAVIYQGVDQNETQLEATTTPEVTEAPQATPDAAPEASPDATPEASAPAEQPEGVKEPGQQGGTTYLGDLAAFSDQIADVVEEARKSVVGIHNYQTVQLSNNMGSNGYYYFYGWPFGGYEEEQPQEELQQVEQLAGSGSGVIYSSNGYIITNYHVVQGADRVTVLYDGEEMDASVIGYDEVQDIALLKVERDDLPAARMGDSSAVRTGEFSIAIGSPLGDELAGTVTFGMVSYANRTLELDGALVTMIQTDAAINSGNSGGALMNVNGEVIGINSRKQSGFTGSGATIEGIGFAIPINEVRATVDELISTGKITRPGLGIEGQEISGYQGYVPAGIQVTNVSEGGPADKAGMKVADIIVAVDGKETTTFATLRAALYSHRIGDTIKVTVYREGRTEELTVTLGQLEQ